MAKSTKTTKKKHTDYQATLKLLAGSRDSGLIRQLIRTTDPRVIKAVCNACLNLCAGDISLSPAQRRKFATRRRFFKRIIRPNESVEKKRQLLLGQRGGAGFLAILPAVISTALGALGPLLWNRSSGSGHERTSLRQVPTGGGGRAGPPAEPSGRHRV